MKAIQITKPGEIKIIEKEMPVAKQGEALLKVLYCGICGADVASYTAISRSRLIRESPDTSFRHK